MIFVLSSYRVIIELKKKWQIDLKYSKINELLGFDAKLIKSTEYSVRLPNISNSIYALEIGCSLIDSSLTYGKRSIH